MLSIGAAFPASDYLVVRSRIQGDLERIFPNRDVLEYAGSDYRYRVYVPRHELASLLSAWCISLNYSSLLDAIVDPQRAQNYGSCREVMRRWQKKAARDELVQRAKNSKLRDKFGDPEPGGDED